VRNVKRIASKSRRNIFFLIGAIPLCFIKITVYYSVYKHNNSYHKMTIISTLLWQHVSAKYGHHQANKESKFRYIKCAPNVIPLSLQN
jgi:hypothetical protein